MSRHTPGLLFMAETFQEEGGRPEIVIRGIGGRAAVAVVMDFGNAPGMQEANAQRLITCWNACLGLPQEKLRMARELLLAVKVMSDKDEIADHDEGMPCTSTEFDELIEGIRNFLWDGAT
jgi:hypothetical protein